MAVQMSLEDVFDTAYTEPDLALPADVYAAGALGFFAWVLSLLKVANDNLEKVGNGATAGVITRSVQEVSNGKIRMTYTVRLEANAADIGDDFAANVLDPYTEGTVPNP